jgi:AraC-like DNA-binding protein
LSIVIAIRFHPGGTVPFVSIAMHEITDRIIDLNSLCSRLEGQLLCASLGLKSSKDRVAEIERVLIYSLMASKQESSTLMLAAEIVESGGLTSVDQLAQDAGISTRQLERRFLNEVGLGPKLLSRIMRFQQVFRAVENCDGAWAPVAVECGYYDQAHLIRDFNQFAKQTPAVLFAEQTALTEAFTRKARRSNFSNT